jgi:hypothetical protein
MHRAGRRAVIKMLSCRRQRDEPVSVHRAEEESLQRKSAPVAPCLAPGRFFQDRNMALTWSIGAPGRIRTRDPLLRRSSAALVRPAEHQVSGYVSVSVSNRDSPPFPARSGTQRAQTGEPPDSARAVQLRAPGLLGSPGLMARGMISPLIPEPECPHWCVSRLQ